VNPDPAILLRAALASLAKLLRQPAPTQADYVAAASATDLAATHVVEAESRSVRGSLARVALEISRLPSVDAGIGGASATRHALAEAVTGIRLALAQGAW